MITKTICVLGFKGCQIQLLVIATLIYSISAQSLASYNNVSQSETVIKNNPIVIHTRVDTYDQPTLGEYQICHENRDNCLHVCKTASNQVACENECPTCPMLVEQNIVVQGINDTDYRAPGAVSSGNTTNIIRLTNEIRNIIENNLGNITTNNENNVHVHQNVSTAGGKFGLGYNQNGSCCIVVRHARSCETQQFSTAERCHHKRHRVCGERCVARVMYAQRTTKCEQDVEHDSEQKCYESITYVPYNKRERTATRHASCRYTPQWPFVACSGAGASRSYMANCQRCYELPYIYVMQQRIPRRCLQCYSGISTTPGYSMLPALYAAWPMQMLPFYAPQIYSPAHQSGYGDDALMPGNGWRVDQKKCTPSATSWCPNEPKEGSGDNNDGFPMEIDAGGVDDFYNELENTLDPDDLEGVDVVRHRRQSPKGFRRSSYSRRHRQKHSRL